MEFCHLIAGARSSLALVVDDDDRHDLVGRLARAFGERLLTFCLMATHLHVEAAASLAEGRLRLGHVLASYVRRFNRRHGTSGPLLRGPVDAFPAESREELARQVRYVHDNPLKTRPPLVERAIDYRWSGARALAGLSLAGDLNVVRALEAVGPSAARALAFAPLGGIAPCEVPGGAPAVLLSAAAVAYGEPPAALACPARSPRLLRARALYLRLGALEGYGIAQLHPLLGCGRSRAYEIAALAVPDHAVRIGRTLMEDSRLRAQLPAFAPDRAQAGRLVRPAARSLATGA